MDREADAARRIVDLENRLRLISLACREFADTTSDYERLLDTVAKQLTTIVRDGCVVRLLDKEGWLTPAAIHLPFEAHVDNPAAIERVRAHVSAPHHVTEQAAARQVLVSGNALLVPHVDLTQLQASATAEIVSAYRTIGIHSLLLVALRVRGESIGLLALVRFNPASPPFAEQDRELAQILADHAALAISNARLLQSALHELAERERAESALRKSEDQLRHAQKMEAVGRLAGGVAHDFNNVLSVILSYAEIVSAALKPEEPLRADVEEIKIAGLRAADLTRQLLAFSRQQVLEAKVLDLNQIVRDMERMLDRLLGADIEVTILLSRQLWNIKADAGQMEQVIMNLAVNARDAMPTGGKLTIETANIEVDDGYVQTHLDVVAGAYVMLAISDTGMGIDKDNQARIFEPFFTTKEKGKGTGLGLATVFGIVKQSGGHIWLYSEPGNGTAFKIYFPRVNEASEILGLQRSLIASVRGHETILLVEDDQQLRTLVRAILRHNGYTVLAAANGSEALLISEQHHEDIHLLLTDVVLPRISGRQLAERICPLRAEMKVLFMSGYTDDAILHHGVLHAGVAYLQKPFTPGSLTRKVREVLDGS